MKCAGVTGRHANFQQWQPAQLAAAAAGAEGEPLSDPAGWESLAPQRRAVRAAMRAVQSELLAGTGLLSGDLAGSPKSASTQHGHVGNERRVEL